MTPYGCNIMLGPKGYITPAQNGIHIRVNNYFPLNNTFEIIVHASTFPTANLQKLFYVIWHNNYYPFYNVI